MNRRPSDQTRYGKRFLFYLLFADRAAQDAIEGVDRHTTIKELTFKWYMGLTVIRR